MLSSGVPEFAGKETGTLPAATIEFVQDLR
jgi:hypothetical protein